MIKDSLSLAKNEGAPMMLSYGGTNHVMIPFVALYYLITGNVWWVCTPDWQGNRPFTWGPRQTHVTLMGREMSKMPSTFTSRKQRYRQMLLPFVYPFQPNAMFMRKSTILSLCWICAEENQCWLGERRTKRHFCWNFHKFLTESTTVHIMFWP